MSHGLTVIEFAAEMERKLLANDHKSHWLDLSLRRLFVYLRRELVELTDAVAQLRDHRYRSRQYLAKVREEAADVANFAMMIADKCRELQEEAEPRRRGH